MKLQGNHIYLRLLEPSDADGNYPNWLNDPDVCRYNSHGETLYTREMAKAYITSISNNPSIQVFAICEIQNNQHIGNISLQQISAKNRSAEFAILLGKVSIYGSGIGFEASSLLFDYGFNTLKLHRIHCGTHTDNLSMQRLALKLGMAQEGIRRNAIFKNGQFSDVVEYGILDNEFLGAQG